jgi:hypothetical protein
VKKSLIARALIIPALALTASSCVTTVSRTLIGSDVQEIPEGNGEAKYFAEAMQYPSYEAPVFTVKLSKTQTVNQSETKRYKTEKQLRTISVLLPAGVGLGSAAAWSATTEEKSRTIGLAACGATALVASIFLWDKKVDIEGEETICKESSGVAKKTILSLTPTKVSTDAVPGFSVKLKSSPSGELSIDLVRDLKALPSQPQNVAIKITFEGNPTPTVFTLDSRLWTKPVFIVSDGTSGGIYADHKTSSTKVATFRPGDRLELLSPEPVGSWLNIVVPGQRDGRTSWVLSSAGTVVWLPKSR